jgi:flagellar biosynthesis/type III secretory pathway M-ring protein FliF/YscJ
MTQSDNVDKTGDGPSFLPGPKPAAPIPRYESGTDSRLRDRLCGTTAGVLNVSDDDDRFSLAGIDGKIDRKKANVAARVVDTDPEQALRVIRNWLLED